MTRRPRSIIGALLGLLVAGAMLSPAAPAHAAGSVTVDNDRGSGARADTRYRTALTVRGSGFQSVRGGFGGVYVLFGWVDDPRGGSWRPSRGGLTGQDYRYVPDAEDASANQGYVRFIAFPGGSTAGEAQGILSADGGFSVGLTVPGPVFESVDRSGAVSSVDCRRVTCGVITIGAHGVKNPVNETFTPVDFTEVYDAAPAAAASDPRSGTTTGSDTTTDPRSGEATTGTTNGTATRATRGTRAGQPTVLTDRATAVAGRALTFTGRGFAPGEQVVAVFDDGVAALGPLVAGAASEVADVLQLPDDLPVETHPLRLTGAASGVEATERFPVAAGTVEAGTSAAGPTDGSPGTEATASFDSQGWMPPAGGVFLVVAVVALVAAAVRLLLVRRRRRPLTGAAG